MSIRKRLLIFGTIWLTICSVLLTYYLVSEAKRSLLEGAIQTTQEIATRLSEEAGIHFHSGDKEALGSLIKEIKNQPYVLAARVEQGGKSFGDSTGGLTVLPSSSFFASKNTRLVLFNGHQAIECTVVRNPKVTNSTYLHGEDNGSPGGGAIQAIVFLDLEPIFKQLNLLVRRAIFILIVILASGLLLGWFVSGEVVSPLRQLAAQVSTIAATVSRDPKKSVEPDDEIEFIRLKLTSLKQHLYEKEQEFDRLRHLFDDQLRNHTADLQQRNKELSEILRLKNDLIVQLRHEVKTPLASLSAHISNFCDAYHGELTDVQKDRLFRMKNVSERVSRLLSEVLEFIVKETGKIELKRRKVPLGEMISQVLFLLESMQDEMKVRCTISDKVCGKYAEADPDHVEQILLNLLHNAIKASPPGATVVIDARDDGSQLEINIRDSGFGIPEELKPRILQEQFINEGTEGSGVGLYITRFLVELHNGRIWFETEDGKGTTFFFTLPKHPFQIKAGI